MRSLILPLDSYEQSAADIRAMAAAQDVRMKRCMERKGLRWQVIPQPPAEAPTELNRRRYGIIEPKISRVFGYHMTPDTPQRKRYDSASRERLRNLTRKESVAAFGHDGESGCDLAAYESLVKGGKPDYSMFNRISGDTYEASMKDPRVLKAMSSWSACMKKKGYDYSHPVKAASDREWMKSRRPTRKELATATSDVSCQKSSRITRIWYAAEKQLQGRVIKKNSEELKAFRSVTQARNEAVRDALKQD
ncbi:hypothetical protein [Streptomyces albidus (ex Kaewkla and Franco 2022)]|uniref:hypothetical protein n=1 Tax=Streptomyces albidus (ex Kaewkla and Franco 2022) TaxID=722709 RepID=UPI0015EF4382|nr:hypothetical protein [Streptomyces albidus (ex Kaewkla and Franco 2022)]